jgi:phage-related protein
MPGSIENAAPATVLPASLCRAFVHERAYPLVENEYRNGESQRSVQSTNSRKRWRLSKRLRPADLQTLRDFYNARQGSTEAFYFYDPYETSPKFSHDPTGQAVGGRHTVRFEGEWNQTVGVVRADLEVALVEVA